MAHAHTIVQRVACATLLGRGKRVACLVDLCRSAESPCVLNISLHAVGFKAILGTHGIDHLKVATGMRNAVACRVAHFVFDRVLLDALTLIGDGCLPVVMVVVVASHELHALHVGLQIVSGMLEEGTHTEVLAGLGLCEPVLPLYVVFLLFSRVECRRDERERRAVGQVMGDAEGTEERAEKVFFLSIEIDAERFDVLHGTEAGFPIFGFKVIVIVGNVSDKVDAPFRVGLITQIGLVVNKRRLVFAFGLKRTEQIAVGLVAQTVEPRQFLRAQSDVTARTQQAERDVSLGHGLLAQAGTQLLVGDVECRRHLVAILRFVAASGEPDTLYHIGIDD